jgi:hypothetical protein
MSGQVEIHDVQTLHMTKVADVVRSEAPAMCHRRCGNESVVRPDVGASDGKVRPEPRMDAGRSKIEWQRRKGLDDRFHECFSARSVLVGGAMHAMEQFGGCYGRHADFLIGAELASQTPGDGLHRITLGVTPQDALELDEDGRI